MFCQILRLLRGVDDVEKWSKRINEEENGDCFDDEVYPNTRAELHLSLAMMLEVEDDESVSISPMERSNNSLFSSCCSSRELCYMETEAGTWKRKRKEAQKRNFLKY